jgi:hypothetical protein
MFVLGPRGRTTRFASQLIGEREVVRISEFRTRNRSNQ